MQKIHQPLWDHILMSHQTDRMTWPKFLDANGLPELMASTSISIQMQLESIQWRPGCNRNPEALRGSAVANLVVRAGSCAKTSCTAISIQEEDLQAARKERMQVSWLGCNRGSKLNFGKRRNPCVRLERHMTRWGGVFRHINKVPKANWAVWLCML